MMTELTFDSPDAARPDPAVTVIDRIERDPEGHLIAHVVDWAEPIVDVKIARYFPWSMPNQYIAVCDAEGREVATFKDLAALDYSARSGLASRADRRRFLRTYFDRTSTPSKEAAALTAAVLRKVARMARHNRHADAVGPAGVTGCEHAMGLVIEEGGPRQHNLTRPVEPVEQVDVRESLDIFQALRILRHDLDTALRLVSIDRLDGATLFRLKRRMDGPDGGDVR